MALPSMTDRFEGEHSKLGEMQVDVVARLANSLGVGLVRRKPCARCASGRATRTRSISRCKPNSKRELQDGKATTNEAVTLAERALALDPQNVRALTVLA